MAEDRHFYLPWYEASAEGLDELAQIKRVVDELAARRDGRRPIDPAL
jgi:hypothetical protein